MSGGGRLPARVTGALAALIVAAGAAAAPGCRGGHRSNAHRAPAGAEDPALARGRRMEREAAACWSGGAEAESHCEAACSLNHSNSCARTGQWKARAGQVARAMVFYRKACDGGSGLGCEEEARVRAAGTDGKPADPTRAAALFRRARFYHRVHCQQGFAPSCLNLGHMFHDGVGGAADEGAARYFLGRACHLGITQACRTR